VAQVNRICWMVVWEKAGDDVTTKRLSADLQTWFLGNLALR